jgi:hypothetical protein
VGHPRVEAALDESLHDFGRGPATVQALDDSLAQISGELEDCAQGN